MKIQNSIWYLFNLDELRTSLWLKIGEGSEDHEVEIREI